MPNTLLCCTSLPHYYFNGMLLAPIISSTRKKDPWVRGTPAVSSRVCEVVSVCGEVWLVLGVGAGGPVKAPSVPGARVCGWVSSAESSRFLQLKGNR